MKMVLIIAAILAAYGMASHELSTRGTFMTGPEIRAARVQDLRERAQAFDSAGTFRAAVQLSPGWSRRDWCLVQLPLTRSREEFDRQADARASCDEL